MQSYRNRNKKPELSRRQNKKKKTFKSFSFFLQLLNIQMILEIDLSGWALLSSEVSQEEETCTERPDFPRGHAESHIYPSSRTSSRRQSMFRSTDRAAPSYNCHQLRISAAGLSRRNHLSSTFPQEAILKRQKTIFVCVFEIHWKC